MHTSTRDMASQYSGVLAVCIQELEIWHPNVQEFWPSTLCMNIFRGHHIHKEIHTDKYQDICCTTSVDTISLHIYTFVP